MRISSVALSLLVGVFCVASMAAPAHAAWSSSGVSLCGSHCGDGPMIATDGAGGAFVVWRFIDTLNQNNSDLYMQRVTMSGNLSPGWPADLPVCAAPTDLDAYTIAPDGSGGAIMAWSDFRNAVAGGTGPDIYAQRILADGSIAPGWVANGVPVTRAAGYQNFPVVLADGEGGAFVTWDDRNFFDIYLQHVTAGGVPAPGWPANGLPICTLPSQQADPQLAPDGEGGVIIDWDDSRDSLPAIYAQRVTADGQQLWAVNGVRFVLGQYRENLISDGAGGVYLSSSTPGPEYEGNYYLQRFTEMGAVAPGWPADGIPVCSTSGNRYGLRMVPDRTGGLAFAWLDYPPEGGEETFAQRLLGDGTLAPGWPANGLRLTLEAAFDGEPDLAPDGSGGAYVCWVRVAQVFGNGRVVVQRVTASGQVATGWPPDGLLMPASGSFQDFPRVVADDQGGAIVTWYSAYPYTVWAQRFASDGPVPVLVSLVSVAATPEHVELVWSWAGGAGLSATVERCTATSAWERLGSVGADGSGSLRYVDRTVTPGSRYAYRLSYPDAGQLAHSAETWVDVPAAQLSLAGFQPNPAVEGALQIAFALPNAAPATLELLDVSGRRLLAREVGSLGAGSHVMRLADASALSPGVYWVRLEQAGRRRLAKGVVAR